MSNQKQDELISVFAKTRALIKTKNRECAMCTIVLDGAECYCNAIFLLLNENYVFPARALMRCLCELAVKLMWCLQCPDDMDKKKSKKTVDEKIRRWEKSTLVQNIKVLKEYKQVNPQGNSIDNQIKDLKKEKDTMGVKEMPPYKQLLKNLPSDFCKISTKLYQDLNKAVHLDVNSLGKICLHNNKINVNNSDISELKDSCFLLAKIITGVIDINQKSADS